MAMYTLTWKESSAGTLYRVAHNAEASYLPEPRYLQFGDLHPVFKYIIVQYRLIAPECFERIAENGFRITCDQLDSYWEIVNGMDDSSLFEDDSSLR